MAIRNDELNEMENIDDFEPIDDNLDQDLDVVNQEEPEIESNSDSTNSDQDEDFITQLLKAKGIEDASKIKFEDDDGNIEERNWDNLSNEEKFNILSYSSEDSDLEDSEIQLINAIRESGLSPAEYLQAIQNDSVNRYIQNSQSQTYQYEVDQYNDDELFLYDFMARMGDVTKEEAEEALEKAKSNETLFAKQIGAIRNEYKRAEEESLRQAQMEQEAQVQEQYNQFADQIADQIGGLSDFSGYDLNMDDDDRQMLYDFITGVDSAGNNYFAKALSDPKILVRTAWLALNGEQMINDITTYFQKEISNVRKESYEKGKADAKKKDNKSEFVYKNKQTTQFNEVYDDLD